MGGAWMIGALHAIASETGWDPGSADYIVGTSAGAMVAALLASGLPPWFLVARSLGATFEGLTDRVPQAQEESVRRAGAVFRLHWSFPRPILGSPELALRSLREPWRYGPAGIVAWLPRGVISTQPLQEVVRRLVPSGWSWHPNLWIVATDYGTGERVAFGRAGAPPADLADAVAASCAIPGFYYPVTIAGRRYVDGGVGSPSNADLLTGTDADLVICLNPMSSPEPGGLLSPGGRLAQAIRGNIGRRLNEEARRLRRKKKRVILVQPTHEDQAAMGYNYMSNRNRNEVIETAVISTTTLLRETALGTELRALPAAPPHQVQRPTGPPSTWPPELRRAVAAEPAAGRRTRGAS